jgi:predicted nucleic acid-binding protein
VIIADASVWIDHFRSGDTRLASLLEAGLIQMHPFVLGELALGGFRDRRTVLDLLERLPRATTATDEEVMGFIEAAALHGTGIGFVDAHLLAAAKLNGAKLWTRDERLGLAAARLDVAAGFD